MLWSFGFSWIDARYSRWIPLQRLVLFPRSWTSTSYFSNSTGSCVTSGRFFPVIDFHPASEPSGGGHRCPIIHGLNPKARVNMKNGQLKAIEAALRPSQRHVHATMFEVDFYLFIFLSFTFTKPTIKETMNYLGHRCPTISRFRWGLTSRYEMQSYSLLNHSDTGKSMQISLIAALNVLLKVCMAYIYWQRRMHSRELISGPPWWWFLSNDRLFFGRQPVRGWGELAVSCRCTSWVWGITGWSSRLHENRRSFKRIV